MRNTLPAHTLDPRRSSPVLMRNALAALAGLQTERTRRCRAALIDA